MVFVRQDLRQGRLVRAALAGAGGDQRDRLAAPLVPAEEGFQAFVRGREFTGVRPAQVRLYGDDAASAV